MNQFEYLRPQLVRKEWRAQTRARAFGSERPWRFCGPEDDFILFLKIHFPFAGVPTQYQAKRSLRDNPNCFSIKGDAIHAKQALDRSDGNARLQHFAGPRLVSHRIIGEPFDLGLTADKTEPLQQLRIVLVGPIKIDQASLPRFKSSVAIAFEPALLPRGLWRSRQMSWGRDPSNSAGIAGSFGTAGVNHDSLPKLPKAGRQLPLRVYARAGPARSAPTAARAAATIYASRTCRARRRHVYVTVGNRISPYSF